MFGRTHMSKTCIGRFVVIGRQFRIKSWIEFGSHSTQPRLKKKQKKKKKGKVSKEEQAAALTELKEAKSGVMYRDGQQCM